MPHARANQILTPSIPFRIGIRAHSHQRARPWNLGLVRTRAEARGWTVNQLFVRSCARVSAEPSLQVSGLNSHLKWSSEA